MTAPAAPTPSLWRNRVYNLLWVSQSLSDLGSAVSSIAVPLLVLVLTGSAVQAGVVGTVQQTVRLLCRLPAGVLADRLDRRRTMLICDTARLLAYAGLSWAVATGRTSLLVIIAAAAVDAVGGTMFETAEHSSLRSIVPAAQLPTAVARNEARAFGASLAGPPLGGLLFGLSHALPFAGNAVSYLASLVGVALIRQPLQEERTEPPAGHAAALTEGVRFFFAQPFLRALLAIAPPTNFAINGALFAIIIILQSHGTPPAVIGTTETIIGAGGLLGAILAPALQGRMKVATQIRVITWAGVGLMAISSLFTSSVLAAVPIGVLLLLSPAMNATLFGYQAAITPDRLQGRVLSVLFLVAQSASALAPVLAGVAVDAWGGPLTILLFAAVIAIAATAATVGRGVRTLPATIPGADPGPVAERTPAGSVPAPSEGPAGSGPGTLIDGKRTGSAVIRQAGAPDIEQARPAGAE
jgi:Na+/melibiose symporter-like transporter